METKVDDEDNFVSFLELILSDLAVLCEFPSSRATSWAFESQHLSDDESKEFEFISVVCTHHLVELLESIHAGKSWIFLFHAIQVSLKLTPDLR